MSMGERRLVYWTRFKLARLVSDELFWTAKALAEKLEF
jgi:hypothetical protein